MNIIYTSHSKSKKRKITAKQRELQSSWDKLVKQHTTKIVIVKKHQSLNDVYSLKTPTYRETPKIPSLPFTGGVCVLKPNPVYTGTMVKGIGTMHKSNAVPVFSDQEARDIATMRRG